MNWGCFRPKATKAPFIAGVFEQKSAGFCRDRSCAPQNVRFDCPKVPAWRPRRGGRVLPGQWPLRWAFGLLLVGAQSRGAYRARNQDRHPIWRASRFFARTVPATSGTRPPRHASRLFEAANTGNLFYLRVDQDWGQLQAAAILRRIGSRPANPNVLSYGGDFPAYTLTRIWPPSGIERRSRTTSP